MKLRRIFSRAILARLITVITVVLAATLVISAWGGHVSPLHSRLLPLATLAFPFVLVASACMLVLCLLMRRLKSALVMAAAMLLSWNTIMVICPVNLSTPSHDPDSTFTVMSFNVMNFGPYNPKNHNTSQSMRYILDTEPDFVLLQEGSQERGFMQLSNVEMMAEEIKRKYPYPTKKTGWCDLLLLSKYPYTVAQVTGNNSRDRLKVYDISLPSGRQLRIIDTHMRSTGLGRKDTRLYEDITGNKIIINSKQELRKVKHSLIDKLTIAYRNRVSEAQALRAAIDESPGNVIVCGDFNETPGSYTYLTVRGNDMRDTFADCGNGLTYTFHSHRMYFKIDHILYRGDLQAVAWRRDKAGDSDHYPQVATFAWKE